MFFRGILTALLAVSLAYAQSGPTAPIKVTTRLVQVNVLVHDHHGNPVADLTKDDFEISDNGKPQRVSVFSMDSSPGANRTGPLAAPPPVMPRNTVTNRPERQANAPTSATVLLLDVYNTKLTDQMYARKQIVKFLRQIRPEDRIAVYALKGTGFSVIHDFTNNSESLLAALAQALPGFSHELDASEADPANTGNDDMDTFIDTSNTVMANFYIRNRVINTCIAFKVLANHLAALPGRKNVIWLSGGFPIAFGFGDEQDKTDATQVKDQELFAD